MSLEKWDLGAVSSVNVWLGFFFEEFLTLSRGSDYLKVGATVLRWSSYLKECLSNSGMVLVAQRDLMNLNKGLASSA